MTCASAMDMHPGACVLATGGREAISAACTVTAQGRKTGVSPGSTASGSPMPGPPSAAMPGAAGFPLCTGARYANGPRAPTP